MSVAYILGRGDECDVCFDDNFLSRRHAAVGRDKYGQVWLTDLGSTSGTYLERPDGRLPVREPVRIFPGDVVWLGNSTRIAWTASA
jgi:pSer/pThr/pTyr-binding forkhead associated (FHA) protein